MPKNLRSGDRHFYHYWISETSLVESSVKVMLIPYARHFRQNHRRPLDFDFMGLLLLLYEHS